MRTNTPERLLKVIDQIEKEGTATLTRLTILKKMILWSPKQNTSLCYFYRQEGIL